VNNDVEFLCSDLIFDFCHCGVYSSNKTVKELASADWILLGADVGIVGRSAGFGATRLLGNPAAKRIIGKVFMGVYGRGFIVEGNQIRGQAKAYKITSRKVEIAFRV